MTRMTLPATTSDAAIDLTQALRDQSASLGQVRRAITTSANLAKPLTGFSTGNPDYDQILERMHAAFGQLARMDDDPSDDAVSAADALSSTYKSLTGRSQPDGQEGAGLLAEELRRGLTAIPASLTGPLGQSMLRTL